MISDATNAALFSHLLSNIYSTTHLIAALSGQRLKRQLAKLLLVTRVHNFRLH